MSEPSATLTSLVGRPFNPQLAVHSNLAIPQLVQLSLVREEVQLAAGGPIVAQTGAHTGRSPRDKWVVEDSVTGPLVWWGDVNHSMSADDFDTLLTRILGYLEQQELFTVDGTAGADPTHAIPLHVVTTNAWHAMFARTMFLDRDESLSGEPFTILHAPDFQADPAIDHTRTETAIALNFTQRIALICGTEYAGEIKKAVFTIANYLLPQQSVLPMHCSANEGAEGDVALFFGLSGTGKTTLSADPERALIGDDEHGWSDTGVFNIEGGCYAKVINLSPTAEPEIYSTTKRFGTILENVPIDPVTCEVDLNSGYYTENTRAAYPIEFMPNIKVGHDGGHPSNIIMLTADAFGVLPPVAQLTTDQAMYHFLSGYTAKVAATEVGVSEPSATFSPCFGAPFLPLPPVVYGRLFGERIARHDVRVWLVNTGWSGGAYGTGQRMPIAATRAIIRAILNGSLAGVEMNVDPIFGLRTPKTCEGVSSSLLDPRLTWNNPDDFDRQARRLAGMFDENFRQFLDAVPPQVAAAGPRRASPLTRK